MEIQNIHSRALAETIFKRSIFYSIYERRLESEIIRNSLPNHIAIILDGKRKKMGKIAFVGLKNGHLMLGAQGKRAFELDPRS